MERHSVCVGAASIVMENRVSKCYLFVNPWPRTWGAKDTKYGGQYFWQASPTIQKSPWITYPPENIIILPNCLKGSYLSRFSGSPKAISPPPNPHTNSLPYTYWVTQKLPQMYTANHATFPIQLRKITVQICGNFCVTQYEFVYPCSSTWET